MAKKTIAKVSNVSSNGQVDPKSAAAAALENIRKAYGDGAIMLMGDDSAALDIDTISTGCLSLDMAIGNGGIPRGRLIEFFGPESVGKTLLSLHIVAEAQKQGLMAAFIDAEHALNTEFAETIGVNVDELAISQPDCGEDALNIAAALVESGAFGVVVVDSVAALVPKAEIDGNIGDTHVGLQARLMSQACRRLASLAKKSNTAVIFINQLREKIGVMFGSPETTPGGRALKFYSSVRLDVRRIGSIKNGEDVIGNRTKVKVVKNKVAPPFKLAEFDILYTEGISKGGDLVDLGVQKGIIVKNGSWYSMGNVRIGQGRENAKDFLMQNQQELNKLESQLKTLLATNSSSASSSDPLDATENDDSSSKTTKKSAKKPSSKSTKSARKSTAASSEE